MVEGGAIVGRNDRGGKPFAPVFFTQQGYRRVNGLADSFFSKLFQVALHDMSVIRGGIDDIRVLLVDGDSGTFPSGNPVEFSCGPVGRVVGRCAQHAHAAFILDRAIDIKWIPRIIGDIVKLGGGDLMVKSFPGQSSVITYIHPAVIGIDQVIGIGGIDPKTVVIPMDTAPFSLWSFSEGFPCFTAIRTHRQVQSHQVHFIFIGRAYADLGKYPSIGTGKRFHKIIVFAHSFPGLSFIRTFIHLSSFDHDYLRPVVGILLSGIGIPFFTVIVHKSIEHVWVCRGIGEADPAGLFGVRQSIVDDFPGFAAIG